MEQDQEPGKDSPSPARPGVRGEGHGEPTPAGRGRHDIVEAETTDAFWPEVDGMLTGEFSLDFLPKAGDYRLGTSENAASGPSSSDGTTASAGSSEATVPRGEGPAAGAHAAGQTGVDPFSFDELAPPVDDGAPSAKPGIDLTELPVPPAAARRGAHDIDPDQLGFNVVGSDETTQGVSGFDRTSGETATPPGGSPDPVAGDPGGSPAANPPAVAAPSARLFDSIDDLPSIRPDREGRLFPQAHPPERPFPGGPTDPTIIKEPARSDIPPGWTEPQSNLAPQPRIGHVPLVDLTGGELEHSMPTGVLPPEALERSKVVDPTGGLRVGGSFVEANMTASAVSSPVITIEDPAHRPGPRPMLRAPEKPTGPHRLDAMLDLIDRQWFTSAVIASLALLVGVVGWIVFLRSSANDDGGEIIAAPSSLSIVSTESSGAGAGAGAPAQSTTEDATNADAEVTTTTELSTSRVPVTRRRPATTTTTSGTSGTTPTSAPTSSDPTTSSSDPTSSTDPTTSSSEPSTSSTEPPTSSTEPPTSSTEPPTSSTEPPTSSTEPPTSSTEPPTSSTEPPTTPPPSDPGPDPSTP